jgi:hypothetical protein
VKASSILRPVTVGGVAAFLLLTASSGALAAAAAPTHPRSPHHGHAVPAACAKRPQAATLAAAVSSSASASDTATSSTTPAKPSTTPTPSESTIASPTSSAGPTASPTTSASPTASQDPPSSQPPTPTPSISVRPPAPDPSPSTSSGTPSPSPSPAKPQLCVQVQHLSTSAKVEAGHSAGFVVWVWSANGTADAVTVTAKVAAAKHVGAAKFTVCPHASGATCALGTLPAHQADELQAVSAVAAGAASTEHVTLTATATGKDALADAAAGSLAVAAAAPTSGTGSGSGTETSSPVGDGQPLGISGETVPPLPGISAAPGAPGNPAALFPTVTPSPGPSSPAIGFPPARKQVVRSAADTASAIVPLDPELIGGQLVGLAVLAGAVAIAIVRLSVRRPRPHGGSEDKRPGS